MSMADVVANPPADSTPTTTAIPDSKAPAEARAPALPDFGSKVAEAFQRAMKGEPKQDAATSAASKPTEPTDESRSAKDFKALKGERDQYRNEISALKAQIEAAKSIPVETTDIDSLRSERDSLSEQLKVTAIERHPKFKAYYNDRQTAILEQAKRITGEHGDLTVKLLTMEDGEERMNGLEDVFSSLPTARQAQLGVLLSKHDELRSERAEAILNSNTAYEALQSQESDGRKSRAEETGKVFNVIAAEAAELEVFQSREGDAEWNNSITERVNSAKNIFMGQLSEADLARASLWAAAAPKYRELLMAQVELNRRLQKQISDFQGASPSVSTKPAGQSATHKSFVERFQESLTAQ